MRGRPERKIQNAIIAKLERLGWFCKSTHGNAYQSGFPDIWACHTRYGHRWIEVKNPGAHRFTDAQLQNFPKFCSHGSGVWVLYGDSDEEISLLFKPPNWSLRLMGLT